MLCSIDSRQNRISADQCHLTVPRAQVSTHRIRVLFWSYPLTNYQFLNDRRLKSIFSHDSYEICCVYVTMAPHCQDFDFKLTSDGKFSHFFKNKGGEDLFLPWSCVGHALRPIFVLWLVKIWQVSSCGKFMQHLESCLLWQVKLTEFCVNLWCF